jgi:FG-GAP repeat
MGPPARSGLIGAAVAVLVLGTIPHASARGAGLAKSSLIRIQGALAGGSAGVSVAGAGDVNGDGRPDVLVGEHFAGNRGRARAGSAYVLFTGGATKSIDLAALAQAGFRIDGTAAGDLAGWSVAGAGDVNGDGRSDVVVGAPQADGNGRVGSGSAYVVFGTSAPTSVDLAALGQAGLRIDGAAPGDEAGTAVAGAGDVNHDARADVIVGARFAGNNKRPFSGSAYVVFGRAEPGTVDLAALDQAGFRIDGAAESDLAGWSVAGAGDVNGDGWTDVMVGARFAGNLGRAGSGSAYVVFGRKAPTTVDLASLGQAGFRIDGAAAGDLAAGSVAGAGDLNGDGRADVLVGARGADNNDRIGSGSAYVVFGRAAPTNVDLAALGRAGFRIDGAAAGDRAAYSVAGPGDVNGDGRADALIGAHYADKNAREDSGSAYVVYGRAAPTDLDLAALGRAGFRIDGAATGDGAGWAVAGAGDLNADGRADLLVGAPDADDNGRDGSGSAYVAFGKTGPRTVHLDTTAPTLAVYARSPQRALRQNGILVRAACDEACSLSASGTIGIAGQATGVRLRPLTDQRVRRGRPTLRLALSASGRRRLARLLARGQSVSARVVVRARDRAENTSSATRTVAVRR